MLLLNALIASTWMPIFFYFQLKDVTEKKRLLVGEILCCILIFIASVISMSEISLLITAIAIAGIFLIVFRCKKIQLVYILFAYIVGVVCSYIVEAVFFELKIMDIEDMNNNLSMGFVCTVVVIIVSAIISQIRKIVVQKGDMYKNKELLIFIIGNLVLCTAAFGINGWLTRKAGYTIQVINTNLVLFGGYMLFAFLIGCVTLKVYGDRQKMLREKQQHESLKEYTSQIEAMYQGVRAFKHDYINILSSISGYLENDNYEELKQYFNESILKESRRLLCDDFKLNQLSNIKEPGFKGLASSKLIYAHELGIKVVIDIMDEIEDFYIDIFDLSRIMGIYFDNAIEAANSSDGKEIRFNMIKEANSTVIILMNTIGEEKIPLGKLETYGYSTKGNARGIGLYNVKQILNKYINVSKSTSVKDGFFVQTLVLQK